ncbi:MAG: A/G-specific adenine glycosylase [Elusimicrobiota bacterium]
MSSLLEVDVQKEFVSQLLTWYKQEGRHDMPWRKTRDPYAVLLSEFMLQQTTVATVLPYYERFLNKFPSIGSLAKANLNDVLALWSGLGYYARARHLWAASKAIVEKFDGQVPSQVKSLESLPGIGPYTAGAIASFAFNEPAAVLDGNIIRVLMRILAIEDDPKLKAVQVILRKVGFDLSALRKLKTKKNNNLMGPRDVNLALMDLGSTVCLPQNPKCLICPVASACLAKKYAKQNSIPMKGETPERPTVKKLFAVVEKKGEWLMGQRPSKGLFGGLWEFIGAETGAGTDPVNFIEDLVQEETHIKVRVERSIAAFEHVLTHRTFIIKPFICSGSRNELSRPLPQKGIQYERFKWVLSKNIPKLGISAFTRRIISQIE